MTLFELFYFLALPSAVALCFLFPLRDGFAMALLVGIVCAVVSAGGVAVYHLGYRFLRRQWPATPTFPPWALAATGLATVASLILSWQSPLSYFGVLATAAASAITSRDERSSKLGWRCLAACALIALVGHALLRVFRFFRP